jgi:PAS domain S-box-containing protein
LWRAVAAEAGLKYTIRVQPFHQLLGEFKEGKLDVLINLAQSDERRQFADFTVPHVIVHGAIFVRKGETRIRAESDLADKSIVVISADLAHQHASSKGWAKQLTLVDTAAAGLRLLASGKHDAMLLSKLTGLQTLQANGITNVVPLDVKAGFSQRFAFAVRKGDADLLGKLNEAFAITKSNGTYNALYDRWFGVYEVKEVGVRELLQYIIPLVLLFLAAAGFFYYRRQVERGRADAALRESEYRWKFAVEGSGDGLWDWNVPTGKVLYTQRWKEMLGYAEADIGDGQREREQRIHADDHAHALARMEEHLSGKVPVYVNEHRVRCKDGSWKWVLDRGLVVNRDSEGKPLRMIGTHSDITARKQAEDEKRLSAVIAASLDAMRTNASCSSALRQKECSSFRPRTRSVDQSNLSSLRASAKRTTCTCAILPRAASHPRKWANRAGLAH